ncbi:MAG TPA: alpha/beta hydrolase-fold protein [Candidatus Nitrosocosmicus sp.]|nr:alpha/beta hydrolase-fold protein [Candidatus Nitrosocosmicus sp.]
MTKKGSIIVNNQKRDFRLHIPKKFDPNKKYALIIALHGRGMNSLGMELYSDLSKKADKKDFIVVYPNGTADSMGKNRSWNAGFCCNPAMDTYVDDIRFINELIRYLNEKYNVQKKEIYVTGFSNGGMLAYKLSEASPKKFAGIAVISGAFNGSVIKGRPYLFLSKIEPIPVLIIHGMKDKNIPYDGSSGKHEDSSFLSYKKTVEFWVQNNSISVKPKSNITKEYTENMYEQQGRSKVVSILIKEGKHRWFGGFSQIFGIYNKDKINATKQVVSFFGLDK